MSAGDVMGHDDADPDDDGLSSLRAAWRSMPDEEPPARGLAELMAAARVKAEEMAPVPEPWWQRALAMLRRPQVLALATIMLVAGGAVLISRHRDGMQAPAPAVEAPAAQPTSERREATDTAREPSPPPPAPVEAPGDSAPQSATTPPSPPPPATKSATPALAHKPTKTGSVGGVAGGKTVTKQESAGATMQLDGATLDKGAGEKQAEGTPFATDALEQAPTSAQLHTRARAAAAAGDCATARSLLTQLQRSDATYFKAHVANDTSLAACK